MLSAQDEYAKKIPSVRANIWRTISEYAASLGKGSSVTVGAVRIGDQWKLSQNERRYPGLLAAAEQIAAFISRTPLAAARLSRGVQSLSAVRGYSQVVTLVWRLSSSYVRTVTGDAGQCGRIRLSEEYSDWPQLYSLQLFSTPEGELDTTPGASSGTPMGETTDQADGGASEDGSVSGGRLSTIPEGDDTGDDTPRETLRDYLSHSDEYFQKLLEDTVTHHSQYMEGSVPDAASDEEVDDSLYRPCLPVTVTSS